MAVAKDFVEEGDYDNTHSDHAENDNDGVDINDDYDDNHHDIINSPNVMTGGISDTSTPLTSPLVLSSTNHLSAPNHVITSNHLITPNHLNLNPNHSMIKKSARNASLRPRPLPRSRRPLSREAKMLLKHASRSLMKACNSPLNVSRKSSRISDNSGIIDQSVIAKGDNRGREIQKIDDLTSCDTIVAENHDLDEPSIIIDDESDEDQTVLLEELQSLHRIIPSTSQAFGDIDSHPCIIRDALGYLQLLRREIKDLNESVTKSMMGSNALDAKVDVHMYGHSRLDIRVSCRKKAGLLAEIINVLESLGLLFDDVNASCHNRLLLKASSTQQELHLMDTEAIRRAIWMTIQKN